MEMIGLGLTVNSQGVQTGVNRLNALDGAGSKAEQSLGRLKGTAMAATGVLAALGVGAGLASSIKTIESFDASLTKLRAISNATATDMKLLSAQARELGATTVYGANQAAQAQTYLAQAGLKVNDVLGATPAVLQFAQAGMLDLGQAADLATDLMAQMGLGVSDLGRISDALVKAQNTATTSVAQLGEAFSYAGPVANSFGLSLEETAAALSQISNSGIKAGRAGTGLLGVLRQLGNVTPQNEELLKQYGLTLDDVNVSARGFQPVVQTLANANLDAADAFKLFGSEAASAGLALTRNAAAYERLTETLGDSKGAAQDMARIMSSDMGSAFKSLQSALDEFVLQLGDAGAAGGMKSFTVYAAGVVNALNGMDDKFVESGGYSEDFAATIKAIAGPIKGIEDQWDEFTDSFGQGIAWSRDAISGFEASFYEAQSAILQFGANGVDAISGISQGVRQAINNGINPLIEVLNYLDLTFANILANIGKIPGIGDNFAAQAQSIRENLIKPLNLSDDAIDSTSAKLRDLAGSSLDLAESLRSVDYQGQRKALQNHGDELQIIHDYNEKFVSSLDEAMGPLDAYISKSGQASKSLKVQSESTREATKAARALSQSLDSATGTYRGIAAAINPAGAAMDEYRGKISDLSLLLKSGRINQLEYTAAIAGAATEYNEAVKAADPYQKRLESLESTYGGSQAKSRQLASDIEFLRSAIERTGDPTGHLNEQLKNAQEEMQGVGEEADEMGVLFENTLERMDDASVDMWRSFLDGSESAFDSFKNLALDTLAEVIHAYTTRQITANLGGMPGFGGQGGGAGSGGLSNLSSLSSISKLFGGNSAGKTLESIGNSLTGIGVGSPSGFGSQIAGTGTAYNGGGIFSGAGRVSNLAYAGYGLGGSMLGGWANGALGGNATGGSIGSAAGAAIGTAIAPGVGTAVGSFLGSIGGGAIGSLFGSSRGAPFATIASGEKGKENWSGGLNRTSAFGTFGITGKSQVGGDVLSDTLVALQEYENRLADLMSPEQIEAVTDRLDDWSYKADDTADAFEKRYDQLVDGVKSVADKPLRLMLSKVAEIDDREFEKRDAAFSAALQLDSIIRDMGGNVADYIRDKIDGVSGSGFSARAESVASDINKYIAVQDAADTFSLDFESVGKSAIYAGRNLVDAAGGLDAFSGSLSSYYSNFYSEAERTERATEQLNDVIGEFGLSADSTREEFRGVIESLNLNSSSGREAYLELMNVQQAFADLVPWAQETGEAIVEMMSASERADAKSTYVDTFGPIEFQIAEVERQLESAIGSFAKLPTTVEEVRDERNRLSSEQAWDERAAYESNSKLIKQYIDLLAKQEEQLRTTGAALNKYGMTQEEVDASKNTYINALAPLGHQVSYVREQLQEAIGGIVSDLPSTISEAVDQRNQLSSNKKWDERGVYQANSGLIKQYIDLLEQERDAKEKASQASKDAAAAEKERRDAIERKRTDLQIELLKAQGKTEEALGLERERLLDSTEDQLKSLQKQVWAAQDAKDAAEKAAQAQEKYNNALESASDYLSGALKSVDDYIDNLRGETNSPTLSRDVTEAQFNRQLNAARSGDRDALSSITEYADRYLQAATGSASDAGAVSAVEREIIKQLQGLPAALEPEDFIDDPVAKAIAQQTKDLSGVIDANGDGTISQLEIQKAQNEGLLGNTADGVTWSQRMDNKLSKLAHDTWEVRQWLTGAGRDDNNYKGKSFVERYDLNKPSNNEVVKAAVDTMRSDISQLLRGILTATQESASIMDDWDRIGQPRVRDTSR